MILYQFSEIDTSTASRIKALAHHSDCHNLLRMRCFTKFSVLLAVAATFVLSTKIKIGVILMESAPEPFDMRRVGPAVDIAIEAARTNFGITLDPVKRNYSGVCPYEPPVGILSDLFHKENIKGDRLAPKDF